MKTFSISAAGNDMNEDGIWISDKLQLVIDGASGLTRTAGSKLSEAAQLTQSIYTEVCNLNFESLKDFPMLLQARLRPKFSKDFSASAALAAVMLTRQCVQFMLLGDCTIILETCHGGIHVYHDNRVTALDATVQAEAISASRRLALPLSQMREFMLPMFRKNRELLNEPNGYVVFDLQHDLTDKAILYALPRQTVKRYVIMSDGWEDLISTFGIVPSPAAMMELCFKPNALDILSKAMRTVSDLDPEWKAYPRLKQLDDYSCIAVEL